MPLDFIIVSMLKAWVSTKSLISRTKCVIGLKPGGSSNLELIKSSTKISCCKVYINDHRG